MPDRIQAMFAGTHPSPAYDRHMGFRLVSWSPQGAVVEAEAGGHFTNPAGVLHGGVLAGLADSAMGLTTLGLVAPGESTTNTDLHIRFLRPTTAGTLRATARVLRRGRRTMALECDVADEQGRLVARASSSFLVLADGAAR
jgi:uncharacterized protein (TIGR00369 family)